VINNKQKKDVKDTHLLAGLLKWVDDLCRVRWWWRASTSSQNTDRKILED